LSVVVLMTSVGPCAIVWRWAGQPSTRLCRVQRLRVARSYRGRQEHSIRTSNRSTPSLSFFPFHTQFGFK